MKSTLRRGAAGSQYALIVGLVAVIALLAVSVTGGQIRILMTNVATRLDNGSASISGGGGSGGGGCSGGPTGSQAFSCTGANQSFTVPAGVTCLKAKLWGAGGGGAKYTLDSSYQIGRGGGGGQTIASINVTPNETLTIIVGQGGGAAVNGGGHTGNAYGGGGLSWNSQYGSGGGGGGRSAIRRSTTELLTAGGGGGSALRSNTSPASEAAGGGTVGSDGAPNAVGGSCNSAVQGGGGTQSAGGAGGVSSSGTGYNAYPGTAFQGGNAVTEYGGGGGGGYYGGGAGAWIVSVCSGSGGGGSGYLNPTGLVSGQTTAGGNPNPAGTGDVDYVSGIGVGGTSAYTGAATSGGHGRVVVCWPDC